MRQVVVFDLDDTLFPERDFVASGLRAVAAWLTAHHAVPHFFDVAWLLFADGRRGTIFNEALERLGVAADPQLVQTMVAVYRAHDPAIALHDDARWAIARYKDRHRLGILTDGYLDTQRRKVAALGIADLFDAIVYADADGHDSWKPSPTPYLRLMAELQCQGTDCIYVSDNPLKDFVTAKALGWTTVRIRREDGEYRSVPADETHEAHVTIGSLYELEGIVGA